MSVHPNSSNITTNNTTSHHTNNNSYNHNHNYNKHNNNNRSTFTTTTATTHKVKRTKDIELEYAPELVTATNIDEDKNHPVIEYNISSSSSKKKSNPNSKLLSRTFPSEQEGNEVPEEPLDHSLVVLDRGYQIDIPRLVIVPNNTQYERLPLPPPPPSLRNVASRASSSSSTEVKAVQVPVLARDSYVDSGQPKNIESRPTNLLFRRVRRRSTSSKSQSKSNSNSIPIKGKYETPATTTTTKTNNSSSEEVGFSNNPQPNNNYNSCTNTSTTNPKSKSNPNTNTNTPERFRNCIPSLQYSGSFNSKSTNNSFKDIDIDFSEEKRLLILSSPSHSNSQSNGNSNSNSNSNNSSSNNHNHKHTNQAYNHRRSNTVVSVSIKTPQRKMKSSTSNNTILSAHSNLGDLLNASKKLEVSQGVVASAAAVGGRMHSASPSSGSGATGSGPGPIFGGGRGPTGPIALSRPEYMRSKSKSTGMISSPPPPSTQYNNSMSLHATASGSMLPPYQQQRHYHSKSMQMQQQQHPHPQQQQQKRLSSPNDNLNRNYSIDRPANIKQTATIGTMNPFDDPSLIGDLNLSYSGGDYTAPSTAATNDTTSSHPLQLNNNNNNNNSTHTHSQILSYFPEDKFAQFDPLKSNTSSSYTNNQQQSYNSQQQQQQPRHQHAPSPSIDTAQLSELAKVIGSLKPQQTGNSNNNTDIDQLNISDHQVTLGHAPKESTGTSKSHRRFLSLRGPKGMNVDEMKNIVDSMNINGIGSTSGDSSFDFMEGGGGSSFDKKEKKKHKRATSMGIFKRNDDRENSNVESIKGRSVTPPVKGSRKGRSHNSSPTLNLNEEDVSTPGRRKLSLLRGKSHSRNNSSNSTNAPPPPPMQEMSPHHSPSRTRTEPHLETIESNGSNELYNLRSRSSGEEIKLRSSENDPTPHQLLIPSIADVCLQSKLCHLMEKYREIDQNFDFSVLANISRQDMESFVGKATITSSSRANSPGRISSAGSNQSSMSSPSEKVIMQMQSIPSIPPPLKSSSLAKLSPAHKPIVESITSAASDLVLSAFYHEVHQNEKNTTHDTTQAKAPGDRTEVAIFASDVLRQFIVVYQGSGENQMKPIRNRLTGKFKSKAVKNFESEECTLTVFPQFEQGYSQSGIEELVFHKLDELAEQHPFFDVIVTGHSYGAMLALLGSMRYACSRPAMMVSCYAFGCPKVGALDFRHYVNSLPNLKVIRLEYGFDPWVHAPDNPTWTHAGHTISILPQSQSNKERKNGNEKASKDSNSPNNELLVRAYKFANERPDSAANGKFIGKKGNRQEKQIDHDIASYLSAIDIIANEGLSWPTHFVGEEGRGVQGFNKEKRLVC